MAAADAPSILDAAAFKAWDADFKAKRTEFHNQCVSRALTAEAVKAMDLHDYFSDMHMKQLWQDYNRKTVPAMSPPTKEVWAQASKAKGAGKFKQPRKVKNEMLVLSVAMPGTWEDHIVEYTEHIEDKTTNQTSVEWMYYGEFERIHGKKEAKDLVRKRVFETQVLPNGMKQVRKLRQTHVEESSHSKKLSVTCKADLEAGDVEAMFKAMLNKSMAGGMASGGMAALGSGMHALTSGSLGSGSSSPRLEDLGEQADAEDEEEEEEDDEETQGDASDDIENKQTDSKHTALQFAKK